MSYLFAAVLLFTSPGCPHEEPTCLTPTEYVEVSLRPDVSMLEDLAPVGRENPRRRVPSGVSNEKPR